MVGWSRRSRESSERRARWWKTLTPEQREEVIRREKEFDKKFFKWAKIVMFGLCAVWILLLLRGASR